MLPTGTSVKRIVQAVGVDVAATPVLEAVAVAMTVVVTEVVAVDVDVEGGVGVDVEVLVAVFMAVEVPVGITVLVGVAVPGVAVGPPMGPAGKGHANAPRLRVHTESVVKPRSICISNMNA